MGGGITGPQNHDRRRARAPVERIGRAEEGDLRRAEGRGQMHRRGIDRDQQPRPLQQGTEGEKIELAGKIDDRIFGGGI